MRRKRATTINVAALVITLFGFFSQIATGSGGQACKEKLSDEQNNTFYQSSPEDARDYQAAQPGSLILNAGRFVLSR